MENERAPGSESATGTIGARTFALIVGALILGLAVYVAYPYLGAEDRLRSVCAQIKPGTTLEALKAFAEKHGLRVPTRTNGTDFMVEKKTFGRYGCEVVMQGGVAQKATYSFSN